jgi:hypothetical protein
LQGSLHVRQTLFRRPWPVGRGGIYSYNGHDAIDFTLPNFAVGTAPEPQAYALLVAGLMVVAGARPRGGKR